MLSIDVSIACDTSRLELGQEVLMGSLPQDLYDLQDLMLSKLTKVMEIRFELCSRAF